MSRSPYHPAEEQLHAYLDGELTPEEREELAAHLAVCEACAARLEAWRALFAEIEELPDLVAMVDLEPRILEELSRKKLGSHWTPGVLVGQSAVAVALAIYAWLQLPELIPLKRVQGWITVSLPTLEGLTDRLALRLSDALTQWLAWAPSGGDLIAHVPRIPLGGDLLTYAAVLAFIVWIIGNHYLFKLNGQHRDVGL